MAEASERQKQEKGSGGDEGVLYTLSEVSRLTDISMPTLQRYKKMYQSRIPSVGQGRRQRYPKSALPVFEEIKEENISRRGRPRKGEGGPRRTAARGPRKETTGANKDLLTLTEISEITGISYPTLVRYVKNHADKLKYEGTGRRRRFYPESVAVFKELRARRGRSPQSDTGGGSSHSSVADAELRRRVAELEKQLKHLVRRIERGFKVQLS